MKFVLVKDGLVKNVIVAEQDFIDGIADQYDATVDVTEMDNYPSPGWAYDGKVFSPPVEDEGGESLEERLAALESKVEAVKSDVDVLKDAGGAVPISPTP